MTFFKLFLNSKTKSSHLKITTEPYKMKSIASLPSHPNPLIFHHHLPHVHNIHPHNLPHKFHHSRLLLFTKPTPLSSKFFNNLRPKMINHHPSLPFPNLKEPIPLNFAHGNDQLLLSSLLKHGMHSMILVDGLCGVIYVNYDYMM